MVKHHQARPPAASTILCPTESHMIHNLIPQKIIDYEQFDSIRMLALKDITPAPQNNINTKFILLDKGKTTLEGQTQTKTCLALVADETAAVHFQFWGDECDLFERGDIIHLERGIFAYSSYNRNSFVLRAGKRGKLEKIGEFTMTYVETPNMSEIKWVQDQTNTSRFVQDAVISSYSRFFPPVL